MVLRGGFEQFFNYYSSVSEHAQMQACHNMHTIMRASWLTAACYRLKAVVLCEVPRVPGSRNPASNQAKW